MRKAECRTVALLLSAFCLLLSAFAAKAAPWTPHPSDGVEMHLTREGAVNRVDFDFHGHGGYAIARTRIDRDLPPNYQIVFRIRANAPPENLELKLLHGDDVWWLNRRDFVFPRDWTTIKTKKRQIAFAWGPSGGGEIKHVDSIEIVVTAGSGGKGTVWFSDPEFEELPVVTDEISGVIVDCVSHCSVANAAREERIGKRLTWADVEITQSLEDGDLPIPSVTWKTKSASMTMNAAVSSSSMLQLRYRVRGNAKLELRVRPFQVNPSTQFLNTEGGVARVQNLKHIVAKPEIDIPLSKGAKRESFGKIKRDWREKVDRVTIDLAGAPEIAKTIRTNLAYTLIHRDGPALEPGSRSYDRSWIRDGSLLAAILLRLGHAKEAKKFVEWFAKYQYGNGKVPCCVDKRGADPVPENDSHGEFIYLIREIERLTGERLLQSHVDAAARYIESLRTYEGLVTESISHEGYSAKPVHSYWDDFFALKGLQDAGWTAQYDSMRADLAASIRRTIAAKKIDYVPGSSELGDFDPSATAIAVS